MCCAIDSRLIKSLQNLISLVNIYDFFDYFLTPGYRLIQDPSSNPQGNPDTTQKEQQWNELGVWTEGMQQCIWLSTHL